MLELHQKLWWSVPARYDQARIRMRRHSTTPTRKRDIAFVMPRQAKISDLQDALIADQEVGGLHVSVEDVVGVEVPHAFQQLEHVALDLGYGEMDAGVVKHSREVVVHVGSDHVHDRSLPFVVRLCCSLLRVLDCHILQRQYVLVRQKLQQLDFAKGSDWELGGGSVRP